MKKGYKRLLIFECILLLVIMILGIFTNILTRYYKVAFIFFLIVLFKFLFGLEKDNHRKSKDTIIEILIFFLAGFLLFYIIGIFSGFYRTENYYTFHGIFKVLMPMELSIITMEYLRYSVVKKSEGSKLLIILTTIVFILLDLAQNFNGNIFDSKKSLFDFFAFFLVPCVSNNIAATYIAYKSGIKPNILWLSIVHLYSYLLPIVPQLGNYIMAIIECVVPYALLFKVKGFFDSEEDKDLDQDINKKHYVAILAPICFLLVVVYLTSAKFSYMSLAVASGSMVPTFRRGDVVIVHKVKDYKELDVGDVVAFNYGGIITVHRIATIDVEDNIYYFYTKGDANKTIDSFVLNGESIIGTVEGIVPFVGYPTIWLSEV